MPNNEKTSMGRSPQGPAGRMSRPGEKPANFARAIGKLVKYSRNWMAALVAAMVLAAAGAVLNLMGPQILSDITDNIAAGLSGTIDVDATVHLAMILLALYAISFAFNAGQGLITATVSQRIAQRMRRDVSEKIDRLPLSYFDTRTTGDVLSHFTNDIDTVGQSLNQSLGALITAACTLVGSLVMMLLTNVAMTAAGVLASLFGFAIMMLIVRMSQKHFLAQQNDLGGINGLVEETFSGHMVVRSHNGEQDARAHFGKLNANLYKSAWKSQFFSGLTMPFMSFVGNLGYVAVCVVGAVLVMNGTISFGVIVAFMLYIRLFTQPLSQIAQSVTGLQSAAAACERLFGFLEEANRPSFSLHQHADETTAPSLPAASPPEVSAIERASALDACKGHVEFDHVRFGYSPDKTVIKDFTLDAKPGSKIAIVGPTGAGKTTIVNLLMRFYEVDDGQIRIDGVPTSRMSEQEVRDRFAMVLQDSWLFAGTVRDNIAYGCPNATDEQVKAAARAAGIDHFIATLPNGYDTVLEEDAGISAGQRQLMTIARAMLKDAPMLILDEATSSVDTRTELLIQEATDKLMHGRTTFVIAHRLSTVRDADAILMLEDGGVAEQGTHDELMERNGLYAALYMSQFEKE